MTTVEKRAPTTFDVVEGRAAPGLGGYYADDLLAVQAGAEPDGLVYRGAPRTPGHRHIRNPAQAVLIRLRSQRRPRRVGRRGDRPVFRLRGTGATDRPRRAGAAAGRRVRGAERRRRRFIRRGVRAGGRAPRRRPSAPLGVRYGLSQALLLACRRRLRSIRRRRF